MRRWCGCGGGDGGPRAGSRVWDIPAAPQQRVERQIMSKADIRRLPKRLAQFRDYGLRQLRRRGIPGGDVF